MMRTASHRNPDINNRIAVADTVCHLLTDTLINRRNELARDRIG